MLNNSKYLLVIGAPRSGTTLLASMISAHPDVAMLIEDKFFSITKLTGKKILGNKLCIPNQIELDRSATVFSRFFKKTGLLINHPNSRKSINEYLKLDNIRIISIIRDVDKVVPSIMEKGKKTENVAVYRWCKAIKIVYTLNKNLGNDIITVTFNDLLNKSEKVMRKISKFLELDYNVGMLEGYKYNLLYPNRNSIDKTRATKDNYLKYEKMISSKYPEVFKMYTELQKQHSHI